MTKKTKVVIVGAGFGGIAVAKRLAGSDIEVTLIDRRNYHLFQPMLYQVVASHPRLVLVLRGPVRARGCRRGPPAAPLGEKSRAGTKGSVRATLLSECRRRLRWVHLPVRFAEQILKCTSRSSVSGSCRFR